MLSDMHVFVNVSGKKRKWWSPSYGDGGLQVTNKFFPHILCENA